MKKLILSFSLIFIILAVNAQEVGITGNKFTVNGSEIWFNGINTPWNLFNDFGRSDFNATWWEDEFERYAANNINLARVWIHGSGEVSPDIDATGYVSGASDLFWEHMDKLMEVSRYNQVYLMPALLSFDVTKNTYTTYENWRAWLQSPDNIQSYIDNFLIPLVQRYDDEPYLLAWEICNEPEWMFEVAADHGPQSFYDVQTMHAMLAAAVHENSTKMVTTGSAAPKWNSPIYDDWGEYEGNMFSDEALSAAAGNPNAFLDFYQYHWYPWQSEWMNSPFTQTVAEYGVDDRPVIVGESEGNDVCDDYVCQTVVEMYESAYNNGFDGVCAWKTPQNDGHGTFENIAAATNAFYQNHPQLVYPDGSDPVAVEGVTLSESAIQIQQRDTYELVASILPSDANDKRVSWSSSSPSVASVVNGLITGIIPGSTTITVTTNDGGFTASCQVTVTEREGGCTNSVAISLPYTHEGAGVHCWETSGNIDYINSWGLEYLEINGVEYTNVYSNNMPPKIDGKYYIFLEGNAAWSHLDIVGDNEGGDTYYNLTTNTIGVGTVSPASGSYLEGSAVTLTANPGSGYSFDSWSGDASGTSSSVSITMNGDKSVTATFTEDPVDPEYFDLTTSVVGQGSINPSSGTYEEGSTVLLTATPAAGYSFSGWSGDVSGSSLSITVIMDNNKSITATFTEDPIDPSYYTLSTSVVGEGAVDPAVGSYVDGTSVTITATAATGWSFASWSGDASGTSPTITIIMNSDKLLTASFTEDPIGTGCDGLSQISIDIPFTQNGTGEYCFITTTEIAYINSWNMAELTINGVDYTNTWSNSLPAAQNGAWEIYYRGDFPWSHFEAPAAKSAGKEMSLNDEISIYPNPFNTNFYLTLGNIDHINSIDIVNATGQIVSQLSRSEINSHVIQLSLDQPAGIYLVRIQSNDELFVKTLIKQ